MYKLSSFGYKKFAKQNSLKWSKGTVASFTKTIIKQG